MQGYMITKGDVLCPVSTDGVVTDAGLIEVISPGGTVYTPRVENVVSAAEGAHMLRARRAQQLVEEGYHIRRLRGNRYHVWQPERHGDLGGYVVTIVDGDATSCTCPDAGKGNECKHLLGAPELLRLAQLEKLTIRVAATLTRTDETPSAETPPAQPARFIVQTPSAKLAALIARDGWGA